MITDAQRRATAAFLARREAEGQKKVTLWLSEEARAVLDALKSREVSKDKIADRAILAYRDGSGKAEEGYDRSVRRSAAATRKDAGPQPSTQPPEPMPAKPAPKPKNPGQVDSTAYDAWVAAQNARKKDKP